MKMIVVGEAMPYSHGRPSSTADGEVLWSGVVGVDVIMGRATARSCGAIVPRDPCTSFSDGEIAEMS